MATMTFIPVFDLKEKIGELDHEDYLRNSENYDMYKKYSFERKKTFQFYSVVQLISWIWKTTIHLRYCQVIWITLHRFFSALITKSHFMFVFLFNPLKQTFIPKEPFSTFVYKICLRRLRRVQFLLNCARLNAKTTVVFQALRVMFWKQKDAFITVQTMGRWINSWIIRIWKPVAMK